jgi:hypothetical protein
MEEIERQLEQQLEQLAVNLGRLPELAKPERVGPALEEFRQAAAALEEALRLTEQAAEHRERVAAHFRRARELLAGGEK